MKRIYALIIVGICISMTAYAQHDRHGYHGKTVIGTHADLHFGSPDRHRYHRYHDPELYILYGGSRWHDPQLIDVVHMKNGSELYGIIIELVPAESLCLVTWDGSRHVISMDEVVAVSKKYGKWSRMYRRAIRQSTEGRFHKPRGYFGIAEVGIAPMFLSENLRLGATIVNGYRFNPKFAIGLGTGFHFYPAGAEYAIPLYLHIRSDFFNRDRSPFFALNAGCQFQLTDDVIDIHKGVFIEPSFGYGFNTGENQRCNFSIGLALDMYDDRYYNYGSDGNLKDNIDRYLDAGLCLKFGYSF